MRALIVRNVAGGEKTEGGNKGTTVIYAAFKCMPWP